jgi:hypothetical protein
MPKSIKLALPTAFRGLLFFRKLHKKCGTGTWF